MTSWPSALGRTAAALAALVLLADVGPAMATGVGGRRIVVPEAEFPPPPQAVAALPDYPIGYVQLEDDPRYDPTYFYFYEPTRPLGRPEAGAMLGIQDSWPMAQVVKNEFTLVEKSGANIDDLAQQIQTWTGDGVHFVIADLPGDALLALSDKVKDLPVTLLNISAKDNYLREGNCRANMVHIIPSWLMETDAVVQYLIKKKWRNVLLLQGPLPADQEIGSSVTRSVQRFGARIVDTRAFLLSNDPRNRDQSNIALITAGGGYDVVYVADSDGEYARFVPYQTNDPRLVVGSAGLSALAWHWSWEGNGAPQVNARFEEEAKRRMAAVDWAAWVAVKAVVQSVVRSKSTEYGPVRDYLLGDQMNLDGTKGNPMSVRSWDHQLRQPILLTTGNAVIDRAPIEGFLHQTNELDTLGVDRPESTCRF